MSERSGLNLRGDFNVENTTSFDATPAANGETMDIDHEVPKVRIVEAKLEDVKPTKTVSFETQRKEEPLNAGNLYPIFWSLQGYFSNPTQLSEPENFETFKNGLKTTMIKFKAINEEQQKQGANRAIDEVRRGEKRKRGLDEEMAAQFNPKYLTSRELFELEVRIPFLPPLHLALLHAHILLIY